MFTLTSPCLSGSAVVYDSSLYCLTTENFNAMARISRFKLPINKAQSVILNSTVSVQVGYLLDLCKKNAYSKPFLPNNNCDGIRRMQLPFHFAVDEVGLWLIHGSSDGKINVTRVNPHDLSRKQNWVTSRTKNRTSDAFMANGILYATEWNTQLRQNKIVYAFNTCTAQDKFVDILVTTYCDSVHVNCTTFPDNHWYQYYSPADKQLYSFSINTQNSAVLWDSKSAVVFK